MSIHEESRSDEFTDSGSPLKIAFIVIAFLGSVMLLVCGGVAGFVAWEDSGRPPVPKDTHIRMPDGETTEPAEMRLVAGTIVNIDLPDGFEPVEAENMQTVRKVAFVRRSSGEAVLKLARLDVPEDVPKFDPRMQEQDPEVHERFLEMMAQFGKRDFARVSEMAEKGSELTDTAVEAPDGTERELAVSGERVVFRFQNGTLKRTGKPIRKVSGVFKMGRGRVALVYTIPEAEYDEEAIVRMIESIRPTTKMYRPPNEPVTE